MESTKKNSCIGDDLEKKKKNYMFLEKKPLRQIFICNIVHCANGRISKGHPTDFTHKVQFTHHKEYYLTCMNCCMMSSVALENLNILSCIMGIVYSSVAGA